MGKSKERLADIKAQAFAILGDITAETGARRNAANVLRLAGVHELDIERAGNRYPDLAPMSVPRPAPDLGEEVWRAQAERLTKLEARVNWLIGAIEGGGLVDVGLVDVGLGAGTLGATDGGDGIYKATGVGKGPL